MALITAAELDTSPPEWLVDGMLPLTGVGILHGPSYAGKSLVVMELALAVANGTPFFGRDTVQGTVVLCLGEGLYDAGVRKEARIIREARDGAAHPYTDERLLVETQPFQVPVIRNPFGFVIGVPGYEQALARFARVPGLELVILDALQNFMGGASVSNDSSANRFMAGAERMARELDCTVLVVAHDKRDGSGMLGAQRFFSASDFFIGAVPEMTLPGEPANGTLVSEKQKYGPPFGQVGYQIELVDWDAPLTGDDGEPTGATAAVTTATVRAYDPDALTRAFGPPQPRRRRRTGLRARRNGDAGEPDASP